MDRPSKVCNLELAANTKQEILGFDVAVDDVLFVAVLQRPRQLRNVLRVSTVPRVYINRHGTLAATGSLKHLCVVSSL